MSRASLRSILALSAPLVAWGCGDDSPAGDGDTGTTTGVTSVSATNTMSSTGTSTDPTVVDDTATTNEDTTTGGPLCETIQCGADCCDAGDECVLGECLPACDSEVRCGEDLSVCCADGEVCLQPNCVVPGEDCVDSYDCPEEEFCEPTLGKCLPQQDPVICEVEPEFDDIEVVIEWSFEEEQSISMPIVADVDGDNDPEVIVSTWFHDDNGDGDETNEVLGPEINGIVMVFDGTTGTEQFRIEENPPASSGSYGRTTMGVADVDGNSLPDLIYSGRAAGGSNINRSLTHAVDGVGTPIWSSHNLADEGHYLFTRNGAPAFANFDADPESEVVWGAAIIDNDGLVVHDETGDQGCTGVPGPFTGCGSSHGSPQGYRGAVSAIADLDGDDYPEIVSGQRAWSVDWDDQGLFPNVTVTELWNAGDPDGYPSIADLDLNGTPEVVLVTEGMVRILDGATGELWCGVDDTGAVCNGDDAARTQPFALPGGGRGGPATIADFDGDGRPEIGAAGQLAYTLFDLNRPGEDIVQHDGGAAPQPGEIYVRWTNDTLEDDFSQSTGSGVFDFQGDGVAEVLYNDACHMRVYNGENGDTILEIENSSATIHEYPIVADVDGDGNTEIIVVANDRDDRCTDNFANYTNRRGVFVYGDPNDEWVRTRRVWNQHTYHVTNSDSIGLTPTTELNNWEQPDLNNYRQNIQGAGVFNAPDLSVDLSVGFGSCLDGQFEIVATIRNEGSLGVPAGVTVTLYEGSDDSGTLVGSELTTAPLLPGEFQQYTWTVPAPVDGSSQFYVTVDEPDADVGIITECDEANNDAATETVNCNTPG